MNTNTQTKSTCTQRANHDEARTSNIETSVPLTPLSRASSADHPTSPITAGIANAASNDARNPSLKTATNRIRAIHPESIDTFTMESMGELMSAYHASHTPLLVVELICDTQSIDHSVVNYADWSQWLNQQSESNIIDPTTQRPIQAMIASIALPANNTEKTADAPTSLKTIPLFSINTAAATATDTAEAKIEDDLIRDIALELSQISPATSPLLSIQAKALTLLLGCFVEPHPLDRQTPRAKTPDQLHNAMLSWALTPTESNDIESSSTESNGTGHSPMTIAAEAINWVARFAGFDDLVHTIDSIQTYTNINRAMLLNATDNQGNSPLLNACRHNNTALACQLLDMEGIDPEQAFFGISAEPPTDIDTNEPPVTGTTPLMAACQHINLTVARKILECAPQTILAQNAMGETAMSIAHNYEPSSLFSTPKQLNEFTELVALLSHAYQDVFSALPRSNQP